MKEIFIMLNIILMQLRISLHLYFTDVPNPYIKDRFTGKCDHKIGACDQQCDLNTGECICRHGYNLDPMGFKCFGKY